MVVKQVKVGLGATINTGNYENLKPEVEVQLEFDENEKIDDVLKAGWEICSNQIKQQFIQVRKVTSSQ